MSCIQISQSPSRDGYLVTTSESKYLNILPAFHTLYFVLFILLIPLLPTNTSLKLSLQSSPPFYLSLAQVPHPMTSPPLTLPYQSHPFTITVHPAPHSHTRKSPLSSFVSPQFPTIAFNSLHCFKVPACGGTQNRIFIVRGRWKHVNSSEFQQ